MTIFDPEKITFFAKTDARGHEVAFGIKAKDRQRHMYVVGKTGMGKSTLLENMAAQDIMNGEGMAFIDPHGSAAETLLSYVPEHRAQDVVYFAPFDLDHPISFNVMEDVGPDKRHLVVSGLMSTFKKIWVDAWSARMEYILTNTLLALIEYPDTTLLSVNRMLADKAYRDKVVEYVKDPAVKAYWTEEFAKYTERFTADALPAIQNKIGQFTGNPLIRNIIGQPHSSFDIRDMMDNQKILIMNLSKGLIGETNANLLGSMLTTRIYLAAMSRADLPVEQMKQMPNFYFYVDEFQSFANATFANILSEARKYHLNLIIAHQYIAQMEEEVRDAVFGNVGTSVAFRVGPFDAEVLETVFAPRFEATDLVNLGFAQIYLTLMIDGIGSQPFSAKTLPPVQLPPVSCREMVIDWSRRQFTKPRLEVEEIVAKLHTPEKPPDQRGGAERRGGNNNYAGAGNQGNNRRPKGPPQNSRQEQTTGRRPFSDSSEERPRNKFPEKSPDDLRQILAKMAGGKSEEQSNAETGSRVTTPEPDKTEQPAKQPTVDTKERPTLSEPGKNQPQTKEPPTTNTTQVTHPSRGKQSEQTAEKKDGTASPREPQRSDRPNRSDRSAGSERPSRPERPEGGRRTKKPEPVQKQDDFQKSTDPKQALADVLKQVQSAPPVKTSEVAVPARASAPEKKPGPADKKPPLQQRDKEQAPPPLRQPDRPAVQILNQKLDSLSKIRRVVVEHRQQRAATVSPEAPPETSSAAAGSATELDAAKIKRMLRQGNDERSPFSR